MAERKHIMDVTKPGKVAPSATARPIIVGHGSMIKDPMVKDDDLSGVPKVEEEHLEIKHEKVLVQPVTTTAAQTPEPSPPADAPDQPATAEDSDSEPETDQEVATAKDSDAPSDDDVKLDDQDDSASLGSEEAIVDAVADQAKKKSKDENSKEKAHKEAVNKLIEDKTYYLPVKQTNAKRNSKWALVLLGLLLVVGIGGYAAIDLGVVKPGFDVPYHVLKKPEVAQPATTTPAPTTSSTPATTPAAATTEFSDKQLGLSFSYPTEWGDVKTITTTPGAGQAGTITTVSFAKQPKVFVGLKSKDYRDLKQYIQAPCPTPGFTEYKAITTALDNGVRVVLNKSDRQVVEELTGGLCSDKQLSGSVKFVASKTYAGFEIFYSDKVTDSFDLAQRIADYKKDYNKYFSDNLRQQFISLTNSVKEQ